uniref:Uncharacterized protein n=1 Tax=viral metagenome TaxID=1070528 RepID=A0A6C0BS36_9ZZZZ
MKKIYENIFDITVMLLYILYFIIAFNLYYSHKISILDNSILKEKFSDEKLQNYLDNLQLFFRTFVVFLLLFRFNPFTKHVFTEFDRKLVFTSSLFLISTTGLNIIISNDFISKNIKNIYSLFI